ncbi:MAG: deoxyguanosinetriphosphate triphosphohydrolase [Deltaproteobacteria bacterium RIFCSPLOWO2_02_FULL_44_10]|nr:MAG: deoxyguanosinetriphosphate triphosphohydrolase [Deltaproteobacteria bacterium RIFCSPHIGHO2_02_FULL_44_16]OGQ45484.1 MAG: deoxyguanosinetriphosphate triphosphohydrolase [Deltaproteobacteria bacterium RIFCSPLOWO2_02_FULL_44_10]
MRRLRKTYEDHELITLASYAQKSGDSRGRKQPEPEDPYRTAFQRDRDRIIHSQAFRRLEYKTQVFVNHEGDYYRTRLTHTLEVAQIARTICRTLQLNEDLAEAIALAHDLGHTPFGHRGEEVLHLLMKDSGGFEHNRQSFRVVTFLEHRYPDFRGLNLTYEVLEGIVKHSGEFDKSEIPEFPDKGYPSLEAQVVDMADSIAYMNHDIDDGVKAGMITLHQLEKVELWQQSFDDIVRRFPDTPKKVQINRSISHLTTQLVNDLYDETEKRLEKLSLQTPEDIRERGKEVVSASKEIETQTENLMQFLHANLYRHERVERMAKKSEEVLTHLFRNYVSTPSLLPPSLCKVVEKGETPKRAICDYIAGMTDRFALDEHAKLIKN